MALTTHEQIRIEAGHQYRFNREAFQNSPNGVDATFYVNSDAPVKFVPEFGTGSTVAGISDVQVYLGLSGVYGVSRLGVSAIDIEQGSVRLAVTPVSGASLVVNYASSAISSLDIENVRKQAEGIVNQRLGLCYTLPLSPVPTSISSLAARLAAAMLLIRGYGAGGGREGSDGYALYSQLMGDNSIVSRGTDTEVIRVGEIGQICSPNYQLVDDDGTIIPRSDSDQVNAATTFNAYSAGRMFDPTEEPWRFKEWQVDANKNQPGSGI